MMDSTLAYLEKISCAPAEWSRLQNLLALLWRERIEVRVAWFRSALTLALSHVREREIILDQVSTSYFPLAAGGPTRSRSER
jgi:hypothetical protein